MNCLYYVEEYLNKCQKDKVRPDEKMMRLKRELKEKNDAQDSQKKATATRDNSRALSREIDELEGRFNGKLAKNIIFNKLVYGEQVVQLADHTQTCQQMFGDDSLMTHRRLTRRKQGVETRLVRYG